MNLAASSRKVPLLRGAGSKRVFHNTTVGHNDGRYLKVRNLKSFWCAKGHNVTTSSWLSINPGSLQRAAIKFNPGRPLNLRKNTHHGQEVICRAHRKNVLRLLKNLCTIIAHLCMCRFHPSNLRNLNPRSACGSPDMPAPSLRAMGTMKVSS